VVVDLLIRPPRVRAMVATSYLDGTVTLPSLRLKVRAAFGTSRFAT
jgi:hypothetical protein